MIQKSDFYKLITEKVSDIIYVVTLDSKVKFLNKSIEQIFDTSIEEIENNNFDHMMLPKDKKLAQKLKEERLSGKNSVFEHGFTTPNGKLVYLECSATPIYDEKNEIIGSLGIARDITEKKKREIEINDKNEELESLVKTKDKFLSVIAHDLRDPFNILIGYSDLILNQIELIEKDQIKNYVQSMNNSANNGFNLLKNLLDWSRAEANKIVYNPTGVNLSQIVDFIIQNLKYTAQNKNIRIKSDYKDNIIVFSDENMIKTVLRNLISNAIKFSYKNSDIHVQIVEEKLQYIIKIVDNGIGISKEDQHKLFIPNSTFSQKGTSNEKGTGLGLTICKEFISKWNGRIWVESELGEGSTFSFSIPK